MSHMDYESDDDALVDRLKSRIEKLEGALKFYADTENWGSDDHSMTTGNRTYDVCLFDFSRDLSKQKDFAGKRARAALEDKNV